LVLGGTTAGPQPLCGPVEFNQSLMDPKRNDMRLSEEELARLQPLAREIPNIDSAIGEIARFSAELTLHKGTIHVISDVHGDDKKLRHVINNASGHLAPAPGTAHARP
jgi:fructose-1,6-bisphosphatase-3